MSVLVKGMKMPSCCDDCWALDEYGDYPVCRITGEQRGYNFRIREKRMDKCPLVPIPPHGRLIDADVLGIYQREERARQEYERDNSDEYLEGILDGLHEAAKQLSIAPTIIEAEEVEE